MVFAIKRIARLRDSEIKEASWRQSDKSKPIAQTLRGVPGHKQASAKQHRAATPIGMAYLVGTNPPVLVSMQPLRKASKVRTCMSQFKIWLKLGAAKITCELLG